MFIWQALKNEQYDEVKNLIEKDPDLVNAINEDNYSLLMIALDLKEKPLDLIEFILTHKNFDPYYKVPYTEDTNVSAIIDSARPNILELILNKPEFLFSDISRHTLSYELVKNKLEGSTKSYNIAMQRAPNHPSTFNRKKQCEDLAQMKEMLREATLSFAKETKNDLIIAKFEQEEKFEESIAQMSSSVATAGMFGDHLKNMKQLESSKNTLTQRHLGEQSELLQKGIEQREEIARRLNK